MIVSDQKKINQDRLHKALGKMVPRNIWLQFECLEYLHLLSDQEVKYIAKFYDELYNDGISFTKPEHLLLKADDAKKEARRNHNNNKRDAFNVAKKSGRLRDLDYRQGDLQKYDAFMDDQSDYWEWQQSYNIMGYEAAIKTVFEQTIELIVNDENLYLTLSKFLCNIKEVEKYHRKDKKTDREISKLKDSTNEST